MKIKNLAIFFLFGSIFIATRCSKKPDISFFCEKDKSGDYVIKWEVYPDQITDEISIFRSENDSTFPEEKDFLVNLKDYTTRIKAKNPLNREFFRLKVNDTYSGIISNRFFEMDNVQNFRDLGGYFTTDNKQMKWGKIYRSGELTSLSEEDSKIIKSLRIKTIIDFRENDEYKISPNLFNVEKTVHIPIPFGNRRYIRDKVLDRTFYREDAIAFTQDMYRIQIEYYAEKYAEFFDILCDEKNYPVLVQGYLGKDKTGLGCYFLLRAVGIPDDVNTDDYIMSNNYIKENQVIGEAKYLPEHMQEAATVFCKTDMIYLNYAKACMIEVSGSVDEYMTQKLRLTPEKREKLKKILLYQG